MLITAYNPDTDGWEKSFISTATSAGVTSITVKNNDRFTNGDKIMIGEMGREKTEIVSVAGAVTAGQALTISATTFPHEADEPVYVLRFDTIKFYRSTTGVNGTYTILTSETMDVDNENLTTSYDDVSGLSSYYYKVTYYNSVSTLESDYSDPMQGTGYPRGTVGFLVDEFLREVQDRNEIITDRTQIIGWLNECSDDMQTRPRKPYDFLRTRTVLNTVADTEVIDFPNDFWKFDRLDYIFDDGTTSITYPVRVISNEEFRTKKLDNDAENNDQLQLVTIDTAVDKFRLYPTPETSQTGVIYLYYWKTFTEIDSEGDELETPNQRAYKMYLLGKYYRMKAVSDPSFMTMSDRFMADYVAEVAKYQKNNNKDAGSPHSFQFKPQTFNGYRKY